MDIEEYMNERLVLEDAVSTWGQDAQEKMLLEEMSELQKEICKAWRGKDNWSSIAEEIADVEIMLAQVKIIYGIDTSVGMYRYAKIQRLKQRLAEAKQKGAAQNEGK